MSGGLETLAGRCEAATGADRELDLLIHRSLGFNPELDWQPIYTASLDAAMTLVPKGYGWRLWVPSSESREPHPFVTIWGKRRAYAPRDSIAATSALALTAAALRAHAAQGREAGK